SSYSCQAPSYGNVLTRPHTTKGSTDWVTMNFVPFAERALSMVVTLYQKTCAWQEVIEAHVLKNIIQATITPLRLKYRCPAQTTWKLAITTLLTVLQEGLQLARIHTQHFKDMWPVLSSALDSFLFSNSPPPANQSSEEAERDESIDCQVVELVRDEVLPYASSTPSHFIVSVMVLLNKGSIESASGTDSVELVRDEVLPYASSTPSHFIVSVMVLLNKGSIESASGTDSECEGFKLREEFAKTCFETLLQFSLLTPSDLDTTLNNAAKAALGEATNGHNNITPAGMFLSTQQQQQQQDNNTTTTTTTTTPPPPPQVTTKLAVTSLLHRFREVLVKYVEDERLSGKCPLPRHRIAEISFVLKAIATLLSSLKKAPVEKVDSMTWTQLIGLYPHLVEVGGASVGSPQLWRSLRQVLLQYSHLLHPPTDNTTTNTTTNTAISAANTSISATNTPISTANAAVSAANTAAVSAANTAAAAGVGTTTGVGTTAAGGGSQDSLGLLNGT
ncbi:hypothetical protein Pcinc_037518, partial [Petrolisthes cinctipes]